MAAKKAKRDTSVLLELDRESSFDLSDVAGVSKPIHKLDTEKLWISQKPRVATDEPKILRGNKKLFGRQYEDKDMISDVVRVLDSEEDDDGVDDHYFTIAPPFLEKDDEHIVYSNLNTSRAKRDRFKSNPQLFKGHATQWDAKELVNEKILDRQQVKDVRSASERLLNYTPPEKLLIDAKAQQNPVYRQSVYGAEVVGSSNKKSSKSEKDNLLTEGIYIPPVEVPKYAKPGDFLFGKEAYQHYIDHKRELDLIEKEEIEPQIEMARRRLIAKRDQIEEVAAKAKEYYSTVYKPRRSLKERFLYVKKYLTAVDFPGSSTLQKGFSETDVRARLETVTEHTPWLIYLIMALQAIAMSILCSVAGVIPPRLSPQRIIVDEITTWAGVQSIEHFVAPNMWAGPSHANLIKSGALFAPCLRNDKYRLLRNAIHKAAASELGCCEARGRGAGTATENECDALKVTFKIKYIEWKNVTCSKRPKNIKDGAYVPHDFKPCCLLDKGDCLLVNHKHCVVLGGAWHISEIEHCSQANCDGNLCKVYESNQPQNATSSSQFWRLPLSIVFHEGIVATLLFGLLLQSIVGGNVERSAGWLRMLAIYLICGVGGLLFGSIMVPYVPNLGSGGAICGFISIRTVELIQAWPLVEKRPRNVLKIVALYIVMFISGLLPGVNQFTNIAGIFLGVLCSLSFMPYIAFTERHRRVMIALRIGSSVLLLIITIMFFYGFYISQPYYTGGIHFLNCLAFVNFACDQTLP